MRRRGTDPVLADERIRQRKPKYKDLLGMRFGQLTVVAYVMTDTRGKTYWRCSCDCGQEVVVRAESLTCGNTASCGCVRRQKAVDRFFVHGKARSVVYHAWQNMVRRCHDPRSPSFPDYGARGIMVCDRWRDSFQDFLADMGEPGPGMSLDRINNDGHYEPGNCRWATNEVQSRNKRTNRLWTHNGVTMCVSDWCKTLGISQGTVRKRLFSGWDLERALTTPVDPRFSGTSG